MINLKENLSDQNFTVLPDGNRRNDWWQTIKIILQPVDILEATQKRYGDIFTSRFASFPTQILISNPQAIQALFTADSNLFDSGLGNYIIQPLVGANSLILLDGERHLQQRKLLSTAQTSAPGYSICPTHREVYVCG
ncbi:hypothetical protein [uncultured Nostoc sp.]|uniref:hypothetical protein n=1 Tax=uncultured Nostoc sp. TaxID=340711 RepID=UPI0035CBAC8C